MLGLTCNGAENVFFIKLSPCRLFVEKNCHAGITCAKMDVTVNLVSRALSHSVPLAHVETLK